MEKKGCPKLHRTSITRNLRYLGIVKWRPYWTPPLTKERKKKRVDWCKRHLNFDWTRVIFSDESYFEFFRETIERWGKRRPVKARHTHGPKIMLWGAISVRGVSLPCIGTGYINSLRYKQILDEYLDSLIAL